MADVRALVLGSLLCLGIGVGHRTAFGRTSERADVDIQEVKRPKHGTKAQSKSPNYNKAAVYAQSLETKLIKGIDKTIKYLRQTVAQMPKRSGGRLEMLERVINLTLEQAAYVAGDEQEVYDRRWQEWHRNGRKGTEPRLDNSRSNAHWREVMATGKEILAEYPKGQNADQISFNGALALQFLGKEKEAAQEYGQLIKRYPKSPIAGDAYFALGDYYFDRNDFRVALGHYNNAVKFRRSQRYGWALFKLGWCYYNLGNFTEALQYWEQTVAHSDRMEGGKGLKLKEEALRDVIFAFAELKQVDQAIRFYKRHSGEKYIPQFLKLLAETYADQGHFKPSIAVWKKLLELYPNAPESFEGQKEIISLQFEEDDYASLWVELERLSKNYGPTSTWAAKNDKDKVSEVKDEIYRLMLYYPKLLHKEAQKGKNDKDKRKFLEAKRGYLLFLRDYPDSLAVAEIKEYLADIEYFQNNFDEAGRLYLEIALLGTGKAILYDEKGKPRKDIHARSAQNMLDAYNKNFLPELKTLMMVKPDFRKPPRALSSKAKNFIKSCGHYVKWYPNDEKTVKNCETFISEIYYRSNDRKMAIRYLWLLATKYPGSKEGVTAVDNIIPLYKGEQDKMVTAAKKLLAIPAYQTGEIGKKLQDLLRGIELEQIGNEKDHLKRAKLYEAQAQRNPKDMDADKLWNNAAADYLKAGYIPGALLAFGMIAKQYPKSVAYPTALLQLGKIYDSRLNFEKASEFFVSYATAFPKTKESAGALERACLLAIALDSEKAVEMCTEFAKRFPEGGALALEKLVAFLWRKKALEAMVQVIQSQYLKVPLSVNQRIIALYRIYEGYEGTGQHAERAAAAIGEIVGQGDGGATGEALRYVGEIAFRRVQPLHNKFIAQRLRGGTVDALQGSIQQLSEGVAQLERAYGRVFATKDSYWGVAAFYQLASAYESFGEQLKEPPAVQGAKPADVKAQLKGSVDQVMAKAKELYSTGLQTSRQFVVYNDYVLEIFNALNRLVKRQVTFEELVVTPDFASSEIPAEVRSAL